MAQLNITLNQEEILQLLSKDHDQAFRDLVPAYTKKRMRFANRLQISSGFYSLLS